MNLCIDSRSNRCFCSSMANAFTLQLLSRSIIHCPNLRAAENDELKMLTAKQQQRRVWGEEKEILRSTRDSRPVSEAIANPPPNKTDLARTQTCLCVPKTQILMAQIPNPKSETPNPKPQMLRPKSETLVQNQIPAIQIPTPASFPKSSPSPPHQLLHFLQSIYEKHRENVTRYAFRRGSWNCQAPTMHLLRSLVSTLPLSTLLYCYSTPLSTLLLLYSSTLLYSVWPIIKVKMEMDFSQLAKGWA